MNKNRKQKLMVIDGNSLIHRAFYALPLLSTKDGIYTNGVYGFLTMLYRIREEYDIDYLCVAFDMKGPTFRHEAFDLYKANRQSTPNELAQQFPMLKEVLSAMNIAQLELEGYEADDIAGTLSKIGEENQMEVILVTGDNDYLQLSSDNTKVLITKKGITQLEEYDEKRIIDEYGIIPKQFIDLKGLMGDNSDNIPGVPGIGEKTGIKLLKKFGTMENLYDNIDKVSGKKRKESLIEHKSMAFLSKRLGEIIRNAPIDFSIEELKVKEPDWEKLSELYEMFEFNSLLSKIPADKISREEEANYEIKYKIIKENNYKTIIKEIELNKELCFEFLFKDDNYINSEILGIGIKVGDNIPYYMDFSENDIESFAMTFKEYFESDKIEKYGHMMKKDIVGLLRLEINIKNIGFDTMIGQYLLNPAQTNYSINELGKEHLNIYGIDEEELLGKGKKKKTYKDLS
ncbi:MAG: DNA polymerase I, partial [Tissierellia bacterium]|nr:DNA polymerase I [Tissierellia bacterium]